MSVEPKKRGRKPKKKPYFGPEEEEAVKKYLELGTIIKDPNTQDGYRWTGTTHEDIQRNRIYLKQLKAPLDKMVESIIRRYKLYSKTMEFEDLHADTLGFLHIKFHKFKPAKNKNLDPIKPIETNKSELSNVLYFKTRPANLDIFETS